ncbi:uncharacterized protein LOC112268921 [Brachypodium distachyon]|uniref:Uncharacterized protein n=1 Tax=Brachypodium distachyon TaxID=15368 RepID=A0A2K2CKM7_BRADI|nr:uncharacterized protein LOC112268921 [Brachypodium distachyon]PNT62582.1 hypothetical protein BRADI_4g05474v3 [Brachypodium distachyon]|eukprot:XP_024310968.1 uncharacterized protein LOC112268921 [Brachypodium distachyon]
MAGGSEVVPCLVINPAISDKAPNQSMIAQNDFSCDFAFQDNGGQADINPPLIVQDSFSTPKKRTSSGPFCGSSCTPECDDNLKPAVGMTFENMEAVEKYYKAYAHKVGFSVKKRLGFQSEMDRRGLHQIQWW